MADSLPQQFGRYQLLQKIATGGMAEIFKAKATGEGGFEKLVAIKRILPHLSSDPEFLAMFMKEAKLAALLSHQNIVQIFDFGQVDDVYYIAMEYLWGNDLRSILKQAKETRPLPIECALYIASRTCAGLEYSHNLKDLSGAPLNIIHRDVNPQNVLITHQGEIKIVDFGIAKIAEKDASTKVGVLKGKVPYMSPEQASGAPIDKRSDIFSAGVLLYEMVTGQRAFQGETLETLDRVRAAQFRAPEVVVPGLPGEIYEILHTALAKNPEQRFQTCAEMFARLDNCLTLFSERQNAENLSRHIRQIFADDGTLEIRVRQPGEAVFSSIQTMHDGGREQTRTLATDAGQAGTATINLPAMKKRHARWIATALVALAAVASIYVVYHFATIVPPQVNKLNLAVAALEHNEFDQAARMFEELLAAQPELSPSAASPYSAALLQHGLNQLRNNPENARALLEKSIRVNPGNARAYFELGKFFTKINDYPEAIRYYRKATNLDPNSPEAFFNLGFLYAKQEDYLLGEQMFIRAIELVPPYLDEAYFNLAMVQKGQGKVRESLISLEQAVTINPHNAKAAEYLARFSRTE
jgi:serine/threonine protein kinase